MVTFFNQDCLWHGHLNLVCVCHGLHCYGHLIYCFFLGVRGGGGGVCGSYGVTSRKLSKITAQKNRFLKTYKQKKQNKKQFSPPSSSKLNHLLVKDGKYYKIKNVEESIPGGF